MSLPTAPTAPTAPDPARQPAGPDPGRRGVTTVTPRAVERIAARAAAEVNRTSGVPHRPFGIPLDRAGAPPRVEATVTGDVVTVRVAVSVCWPDPVRRVTRQIRAHVTDRVHALTGLRVAWVDIEVPRLATGAGPGRVG
ncbi:MAG TPA: Asp23/Gls24 family envelope stress response protein [Mycobacteriales bacterium]|nr:Asp23/Gls24 family envelope stress response protein [Mycobacteriales bacterium]